MHLYRCVNFGLSLTVCIVIAPVIFIITAVACNINMCCKTFMCIMLTWKDTREVINLNYSIFLLMNGSVMV